MNPPSSLRAIFMDRLLRCLVASAGLVIFALGAYLQLVANIGLPPWQALNEGLGIHLGLTMGTASIIMSIIIVSFDVIMREPIGLGTLVDVFVFGWALDFFIWLDFIPYQTNLFLQCLALLASIVVVCIGQYVYMKAALSCGPRDALLVALGKRTPRLSIGTVQTVLLLTVMVAGYLLGGTVGFGTLFHLVATGPLMDVIFKFLKFEPRSIVHESLPQTVRCFRQAAAAKAN